MKSLSQIDVLKNILKLFLLILVTKYKLILLQYLYHVLCSGYEPFFTAINITTPQKKINLRIVPS